MDFKSIIENVTHWKTTVPSWVPAVLVFALTKTGLVSPDLADSIAAQVVELLSVAAGLAGTFLLGSPKQK